MRWIPSSLVFTDSDSDAFDDFVPPPPVNIIHPKPSANLATNSIKYSYLLIVIQNSIIFFTDDRPNSLRRVILTIAIISFTIHGRIEF